MQRYNSFDEIMNSMINPLDNPDFYALLITEYGANFSGPVPTEKRFSLCHEIDFSSSTPSSFRKLMILAMKKYLDNISEQACLIQTKGVSRSNLSASIIDFENAPDDQDALKERINSFFSNPTKANWFAAHLGTNCPSFDIFNWFYFRSNCIDSQTITDEIHTKDVKHRLYLSVDDECRATMAEKIIEKCEKANVPYLFKVLNCRYKNSFNQQSDSMVFYLSTSEQVTQYVNFINEILQENPELTDHIHKPSPHLGIINDFVGYGFEPQFKLDNQQISYSEFMQEAAKKFYLSNRSFRSLSRKILEDIRDHYQEYRAQAQHFINTSTTYDNLVIPYSSKACEEMIQYNDDYGNPKGIKMKKDFKDVISGYIRIKKSENAANFSTLEEQIKKAMQEIVPHSTSIPMYDKYIHASGPGFPSVHNEPNNSKPSPKKPSTSYPSSYE